MRLVHFSKRPLELPLRDRSADAVSVSHKPSGLWVSDEECEDSWSRWCDAEQFDGLGDFRYEVTLNGGVLVLGSSVALIDFTEDYRLELPGLSDWVNWPAVMKAHGGIVITPYQWSQRMELNWYYGWDCASGCIWSPAAIKEVRAVE